eukprot:TRINITY_DN12395_c2_g2_i1.p1 TRINITY_DN12395_c2_g2~~TRINITY_DN12395_c2_g2_i1.p1  ORF type:complete len:162 (+),score=12.36 TRINITY_DN12395_c2_g2_i1:176-661(+)
MATNFWLSSHRQNWLFNSAQLAEVYHKHGDQLGVSVKDQRKLIIFFSDLIEDLAKADDKHQPRQDVIGTAIIYFRRFYKVHSWIDVDPFVMAATCVYTAFKTKEFGTMSLKTLHQHMFRGELVHSITLQCMNVSYCDFDRSWCTLYLHDKNLAVPCLFRSL